MTNIYIRQNIYNIRHADSARKHPWIPNTSKRQDTEQLEK